MAWITSYEKISTPTIYKISFFDGLVNFIATINNENDFKNCVYAITEPNTGIIYIGKANRLVKRIETHRLSILACIKVLNNKRVNKVFPSYVLNCHKEFAKVFIDTGHLDINFTILSGTTKNLKDIEDHYIKIYSSDYPNLILNKRSVFI